MKDNIDKEIWKLDRSPCQNCTREIIEYVKDRLEAQPNFKLSLGMENIYTKAEGIEKGKGSMEQARRINATSLAAMKVIFPVALNLKYARMYENVENKENTKSGNPHPLVKQRQEFANDNLAQGHAENMKLVIDPLKTLAGKIEEIANGQPGDNIESIRGAIESMVKSDNILKNLLQGKEGVMIDTWKSQGMTTVGSVKSTMKAILEGADNLIKYSVPANDNQASSSNKKRKRAPGT